MDRDLLLAIAVRFSGGPVGLSTLAVSLGEEPDTIEDVYEPYLLQLGFIQRTPRGRIVTPAGRAHVGMPDLRETGSSLF
jgi:Holliday junction DNA helicase RuvB